MGTDLAVFAFLLDFVTERAALHEYIFPKVRAVCREAGYDLTVVDLMSNMHNAFPEDHGYSAMAAREIASCQAGSAGPCFISLLGQHYGHRSLPSEIALALFDKLLHRIDDHDSSTLIRSWYKKDENVTPPVVRLQPVAQQLPDYRLKPDTPSNREKFKRAANTWNEQLKRMQAAFQEAVTFVCREDDDQGRSLMASMLENEVQQGLLRLPADTRCDLGAVFARTIRDLAKNAGDAATANFAIVQDKQLEADAQAMLQHLKEQVSKAMGADSLFTYEVGFSRKGLEEPMTVSETKKYLQRFMQDAETQLKVLVQRSISRHQAEETRDPLVAQVLFHSQLALQLAADFVGRADALDVFNAFVQPSSPTRLLVVHGSVSSGKTAFMAKCLELVGNQMPDTLLLARFVGRCSESCHVYETIAGLYRQLMRSEFRACLSPLPEKLTDLLREFWAAMVVAAEKRPVLLCLVNVHHLESEVSSAAFFEWLPSTGDLPNNIKIIISVPSAGPFLAVAKTRSLTVGEQCLTLEVTTAAATLEQLLDTVDARLQARSQSITVSQRKKLESCLTQCNNMLFFKLAYLQITQWSSLTQSATINFATTVKGMIKNFFHMLEVQCGARLVRLVATYLVASRHGLSEPELLDLLSCEDDLLRETLAGVKVTHWRFPMQPWCRLRRLIEPLLTSFHMAEGPSLMSWADSAVLEYIEDAYMSDKSVSQTIHSNLADFFLGRWADGEKNMYADTHGAKIATERHCASQPSKYQIQGLLYNIRKLSELPYHLSASNRTTELESLCLYNFAFLSDKSQALSLRAVLRDFALPGGLEASDHVLKALQASFASVTRNSSELASQLVARLSGILPTQNRDALLVVETLVDQAREVASKQDTFSMIPARACLQPVSTAENSLHMINFACSADLKVGISISASGVTFWDIPASIITKAFPGDFVHRALLSSDGLVAVVPRASHFVVFNTVKMSIQGVSMQGDAISEGQEGGHSAPILCEALIQLSTEGPWHVLTGSQDKVIKLWNTRDCACSRTFRGHEAAVTHIVVLEAQLIASADAKQTVRVWNIVKGNSLHVFELEDPVTELAATADLLLAAAGSHLHCFTYGKKATHDLMDCGASVLSVSGQEQRAVCLVRPDVDQVHDEAQVWDLETKALLAKFTEQNGRFLRVFMGAGGLVVTLGEDRRVKAWDPSHSRCLNTFTSDFDLVPINRSSVCYTKGAMVLALTVGRVTTLTLPALAKERAKTQGVSIFGHLGNPNLKDLSAALSKLKTSTAPAATPTLARKSKMQPLSEVKQSAHQSPSPPTLAVSAKIVPDASPQPPVATPQSVSFAQARPAGDVDMMDPMDIAKMDTLSCSDVEYATVADARQLQAAAAPTTLPELKRNDPATTASESAESFHNSRDPAAAPAFVNSGSMAASVAGGADTADSVDASIGNSVQKMSCSMAEDGCTGVGETLVHGACAAASPNINLQHATVESFMSEPVEVAARGVGNIEGGPTASECTVPGSDSDQKNNNTEVIVQQPAAAPIESIGDDKRTTKVAASALEASISSNVTVEPTQPVTGDGTKPAKTAACCTIL